MKPQEINPSKKALARTKARMKEKCVRNREFQEDKCRHQFTAGFNVGWKEAIKATKRRNDEWMNCDYCDKPAICKINVGDSIFNVCSKECAVSEESKFNIDRAQEKVMEELGG